jgi:hypothetical protein
MLVRLLQGVVMVLFVNWSMFTLVSWWLSKRPCRVSRTTPDDEVIALDSDLTREELIRKFCNPSNDEQQQTLLGWLLKMVGRRRIWMVRLRVFTVSTTDNYSVRDYPDDAEAETVFGLPWVAVVHNESTETWNTL